MEWNTSFINLRLAAMGELREKEIYVYIYIYANLLLSGVSDCAGGRTQVIQAVACNSLEVLIMGNYTRLHERASSPALINQS